jgi:hypothetical protein
MGLCPGCNEPGRTMFVPDLSFFFTFAEEKAEQDCEYWSCIRCLTCFSLSEPGCR